MKCLYIVKEIDDKMVDVDCPDPQRRCASCAVGKNAAIHETTITTPIKKQSRFFEEQE